MPEMFPLRRFSKNVALVAEDESLTYEQLWAESEAFAEKIGRRCLLFLLCQNVPAAIIAYAGCLNNGIVPVMLDSNLEEGLLSRLVEIYRPDYVWQPKTWKEFLGMERKASVRDYVLWQRKEGESAPLNDDLALLMTTSGSTGSPKLVRLSYGNIRANTKSIIKYLDINEQERAITNLPLHYVYGLSIVNTHLYSGASLVVTEKTMFQKEFWQLFKEKEITSLAGVPYTYEMLERLCFFRMELPSLCTITQAGGKLDPELHRKFAEYAQAVGKHFVVMYGAAEATARMGYLPYEYSLRKYGSIGIAIPDGNFELEGETGSIIEEPDIVGELIYHGPNVMMGYAQCGEDLSRGDEMHGVLRTGDLAKRDEEGFYTIVGRKKRFLKMFGKRTNLEEVEQILRQHFQLVEIACGGMDDRLYVFLTQESLDKEVVLYLRKKLGLHPSAIFVKQLEEIPKNASGKTLYKDLERYYVKG